MKLVTELSCKRCGHTWIPRSKELPLTCPKCRSPYWNKSRKNAVKDNDGEKK